MESRYKSGEKYYPSDIARYDIPSRRKKAGKIWMVISHYFSQKGVDFSNGRCLDIGCGPAVISNVLAEHFATTIGVDLDARAIAFGNQIKTSNRLYVSVGNVEILPYPAEKFDVVICAQVYEHVSDPEKLVSEIWRVLKPGGICFFSGPNRLAFMEEHYFLPFLSWLPRPLANGYVRLFKKTDFYDAYPRYLWQVKQLWHQFHLVDYTFELFSHPEKFGMNPKLRRLRWLIFLPGFLKNLFLIFVPNFNWILEKPSPK